MSIEAEKSVIGAVLLDNSSYSECELSPADFENFYHQNIWEIISELADKDKPVDLVTITIEAKEQKLLDQCGGSSYLSELVDYVPTAANVKYYCDLVRRSSIRRKIAELGRKLQEDQDSAIELVEETLYKFIGKDKSESLESLAKSSMKVYEERYKRGLKLAGISYGYDWFDTMTGGITPGQLIIIAARPSMGKTALALNICIRSKAKGYFVSLETSRQSITDRIFAQIAKINLSKFRNGNFDSQDFPVIVNAAGEMQASGIHIDDTPSLSVLQLRQRSRRHKIKHGLDFIIVDYLQLMTAKAENRFQEVSQISRQLKALAKDVAPVIALCQLSRAGDGERPSMAHLRESGQIEQDADLILFPYREAANCDACKAKGDDCGKSHYNLADITIAKQKDGPLGRKGFYWTGRYQSFEEY